MSRYNKIFAGPVSAVLPQVIEAVASAAVMPGSFVTADGAPADNTTKGKVLVVQENYLEMKGISDTYAIGDNIIAMELLPQLFYNALLATGNNVSRGAALALTADSTLAIAGAGDFVVVTADETYNNNTGADQLIRVRPALGYIIPAV